LYLILDKSIDLSIMGGMPSKAPTAASSTLGQLTQLGQRIRSQRKALGLNAATAAEAAAMSRVTFHRIEAGEPSVTMGAYLNAITALGLRLDAFSATEEARPRTKASGEEIPESIELAAYPELRRLAWHARGLTTLTPEEAFNIYERNGRHLDLQGMSEGERLLLQALIHQFGKGQLLV
jgi:transcriptional regulator with XRE-family HTH domain